MSLYLCVDCGGSKTSAIISSASGEIIGRALSGPSNFTYLGPSLFAAAVHTAVSTALQTCTTPPSANPVSLPPPSDHPQFAIAWFGISGLDSPAAVASLTPVLSEMLGIPPGPQLIIAHDTHLLAAPLRLHNDVSHAVAVVAGTGSCVVSFRETSSGTFEEMGRTGGWGWILGDEGGGFHVGREAVRQIVLETDRASLGGAPPPKVLPNGKETLRQKVLERFGVSDGLEILTVIHLPDPTPTSTSNETSPGYLLISRETRLSSLAPLVFSSAFDDGDPLALSVLGVTSSGLADQVALLLDSNLGPRAIKAEESVICFGGSLVRIEKYRQLVLDDLKGRGHVFRHVEFVEDVAGVGAVGLASANAGTRVLSDKSKEDTAGTKLDEL